MDDQELRVPQEAEINEDRYQNDKKKTESGLIFELEDVPPWPQLLVLSLQQFFSAFSSLLVLPTLLSTVVCFRDNVSIVAKVLSATFLMQGFTTTLQASFGVRLPIVQGASFSYIPPAIALMSYHGGCEAIDEQRLNITPGDEPWRVRLAEINGGLLVASLIEILIAVTGVLTILMRFIGPLAIAPVIIILGTSLCEIAWSSCEASWGLALFTGALTILFSQIMKNVKVPVVAMAKNKGFYITRSRVFQKFSLILALLLGWLLSYILTVSGVFSDDPSDRTYRARTDINNDVFNNTVWIRFPYPGQVVWPKPTVTAFFGMLAAVIACTVESLGDYSACASICKVPTPPAHAINRGIAVEGLGGVLSCTWGTGTGTASYSTNIVVIGITKVGSRRVIQVCGVVMMVLGIVPIFGSFFVTIPDPVIGGTLMVKLGMIISIGISVLRKVDLNSSRNQFVLGLSLFFGIAMPKFIQENPGAINTGSPTVDSSVSILLKTGIFVGFVVAVFFDNIIPGTLRQRGLLQTTFTSDGIKSDSTRTIEGALKCYDFPFGMNLIRSWKFTQYIPISPTFRGLLTPKRTGNRVPHDIEM